MFEHNLITTLRIHDRIPFCQCLFLIQNICLSSAGAYIKEKQGEKDAINCVRHSDRFDKWAVEINKLGPFGPQKNIVIVAKQVKEKVQNLATTVRAKMVNIRDRKKIKGLTGASALEVLERFPNFKKELFKEADWIEAYLTVYGNDPSLSPDALETHGLDPAPSPPPASRPNRALKPSTKAKEATELQELLDAEHEARRNAKKQHSNNGEAHQEGATTGSAANKGHEANLTGHTVAPGTADQEATSPDPSRHVNTSNAPRTTTTTGQNKKGQSNRGMSNDLAAVVRNFNATRHQKESHEGLKIKALEHSNVLKEATSLDLLACDYRAQATKQAQLEMNYFEMSLKYQDGPNAARIEAKIEEVQTKKRELEAMALECQEKAKKLREDFKKNAENPAETEASHQSDL